MVCPSDKSRVTFFNVLIGGSSVLIHIFIMTKKNSSIFLANAVHAQGPWQLKRGGSPQDPTYTLVDFYGNPICEMIIPNNPDRSYTPAQFLKTCDLLLRAPKLLAAVLEYAYNLDERTGSISEELVELIRSCGGRDLTERLPNDNKKTDI